MPAFIDTNRAQRIAPEWPLLPDFCLWRRAAWVESDGLVQTVAVED